MTMTMTSILQPSGDGPFGTAEQAHIRYAGYARAASGQFGPAPRYSRDMLTDTLDTIGVRLGDYDRDVVGRLGELLGVVDCAVVNSLFQRAAGDTYDETVYVVNPDLELPEAGQ
jgi:hypothetical protein